MTEQIIIIGSGFAARQLVTNLRRQDKQIPIMLIAADSGDQYNKPDLSHVFSLKQSADDLTQMSAEQFAQENNLKLQINTQVTAIDSQMKHIICGDQKLSYHKLVLATGAQAIVPSIPGRESMVTFNSQGEYRKHQSLLQTASRILVLGGGLVGTELAMDLHRAGKQVTVIDRAHSLLASLMPAELSCRLQHKLSQMGIRILLNNELVSIDKTDTELAVNLLDGHIVKADAVIAAIGIQPDLTLATTAGLKTGRGVCVNRQLQTSDEHIYALGDCAEIEGKIMPFLQPIQMSSLTLAKNLLGATESVIFPPMLLKVKTPDLPLFLAGDTQRDDLNWELSLSTEGIAARGFDAMKQLRAFVVSEQHTSKAFMMLRELNN
ncbi:NADH:flavorubredoxin reductase NorW [uncultured Cedecea sp.]|uniref:NADH:flavorubredoxin reductase NorW n=1 Tax=uncultured Cedecea sp. TaxID=988762 RepID=UPI002626DD64|nr:NADH:flavorubredoxin reductase NorW [uncultured Cedecea sp.]